MSPYSTPYGMYGVNTNGYATYGQTPNGQSPYSGPTLYNYNNTGNPGYGLYGMNPSYLLAESPYARMTGQYTSLSSQAIPNLSSFIQPMMVDMNAFTGRTGGVPSYPSFIGATAMNNSQTPLYSTFQDYLNQNSGYQQSYQNSYQQPYQNYSSIMMPAGGNYQQVQPSYGYQQQYSSYPQQNYGYQQQQYQQNPFVSMSGTFPGTCINSYQQAYSQQNNFYYFG